MSVPPNQNTTGGVSMIGPEVVSKIEDLRQRWGVKGIALALVGKPGASFADDTYGRSLMTRDEDGWVRQTICFGVRDGEDRPVEEDCLFPICSNSKFFTALAVGLLIKENTRLENGQNLKWTTKIKDILPQWKLHDAFASDLTDLADLATMQTGLPKHLYWQGNVPASEEIKTLQYLKSSTELRKAFQYSNASYSVLSEIVPTLAGIPFTEFVRTRILLPIGLNTATYDIHKANASGRVFEGFLRTGSEKNVLGTLGGEARSIEWYTQDNGVNTAGSAGILISPDEMTKLLKELLLPTNIPEDIIDECCKPRVVTDGNSNQPEIGFSVYGFGQEMFSYRGRSAIGHSGLQPGHALYVCRLPELGSGLCVMINDQEYGLALCEIVRNTIFDSWINRGNTDWEKRFIAKASSILASPATSDSTAPPHMGWDRIPGRYHHRGYGDLTLSRMEFDDSSRRHFHNKIRNILAVLGGSLNFKSPTYIAYIDKLFASHFVFTHISGSTFNCLPILVATPSGVPNAQKHIDEGSPVLLTTRGIYPGFKATITENGIAMHGDFWGQGNLGHRCAIDEEDLEGSAEVWFDKIA